MSPLKGQNEQGPRSLRDVAFQIDNERDFNSYVAGHSSKVPNTGDIEYKRHPTLAVQQQQQQQQPPSASMASRSQPMPPTQPGPPPTQQPSSFVPPTQGMPPQPIQTQNYPPTSGPNTGFGPPSIPPNGLNSSPKSQTFASSYGSSAPQLPPAQTSTPFYSTPPTPISALQNNNSSTSLPALKPVFGVSLEDLLKRDGSAIPLVVYQCIQAIDLYGVEMEGIYRVSGSATHVAKLKAQFDHGRQAHKVFHNQSRD